MHKLKLAAETPTCINRTPEALSAARQKQNYRQIVEIKRKVKRQGGKDRKVKEGSRKDSQWGASMIVVVTRENRSFYVCPNNSPVADESV